MDLSALQIVAALAFILWACPPLPERLRPIKLLKDRGVPRRALQAVDLSIAFVAGLLIGEWWALLLPLVALTVGFRRTWNDEERRAEMKADMSEIESKAMLFTVLLGIVGVVEVLPVAIGVMIAQAI